MKNTYMDKVIEMMENGLPTLNMDEADRVIIDGLNHYLDVIGKALVKVDDIPANDIPFVIAAFSMHAEEMAESIKNPFTDQVVEHILEIAKSRRTKETTFYEITED